MRFAKKYYSAGLKPILLIIWIAFGTLGLLTGSSLMFIAYFEGAFEAGILFPKILPYAVSPIAGAVVVSIFIWLFSRPGYRRFRRLALAQQAYPEDLDDAIVKTLVGPVKAAPEVFAAGEWLVAPGQAAVKRKNIQKLQYSTMQGRHGAGSYGLVTLSVQNLPVNKVAFRTRGKEPVRIWLKKWYETGIDERSQGE